MNSRSCFEKSALALVALALVATGAVWAQPTPGQYPGSYSNDGVRQTPAGGWVMPYDECGLDASELGALNQTACTTAGWNWDPNATTGSNCYYNRFECNARIFYAEDPDAPATGDVVIGSIGVYSDSGLCNSSQREWVATACDDVGYRNRTDCENGGHTWYANVCRGKFYYSEFAYTYSDATLNNYNDCTKCHNNRHYPASKGIHEYHGEERGVGETYAMTGHKNMQRPVAPDSLDLHYLSDAPWLDKTGAVITEDIFGQSIDFPNATVETAPGVYADLWYLRDWIAPAPEPIYTGGEADTCARCHSTGFDATYVETTNPPTKQPYIMFPDFPVDQATGGWDQWGIQCSRCHGSQLVYDTTTAGNKMDLRHHPGIANSKMATNNAYPTKARCEADGFTWGEYGSTLRCYNPLILSSGACTTALGTWDSTNSVCYYSLLASGATKTNLCFDCHASGTANPAGEQRVGSQHGLELDFTGHFQTNQFLNSPHARYATGAGTGTTVGDKTKYDTHFQFEGESYPFDNTIRNKGLAGGCTQCHDVHKSALAEANPDGGAIHEECTECHAKNLTAMFHPPGKGTPMEEMGVDPNEACVICHMPKTEDGRPTHFFRVNVDPAYEVFPSTMFNLPVPSGLYANTATDDGYTKAVWNDLDHTCGQCHGGGTEYKETSGTIAAGSNLLTVADATGFVGGERVVVKGAGADGEDLLTWVSNVAPAGNVVTLVQIPLAGAAVTDAEVILNPTKNGAGYISKAQLATLAKGIHNDAPVANFTYTLGNPNTQEVTFSAAASTCNGSAANCDVFAWEFGDGQTGTGIAPVHAYAAPGTYAVTLTVTQYGVGEGEKEKDVTTYAQDLPSTIGMGCNFVPNTWQMTVTDSSTDDNGLTLGVVDWGDGSLKSSDATAPFGPFTHTYATAGSFVVTYKIADSVGQVKSDTCFANPNTFTIGGGVDKLDGTTPVGGVTIKVWDGTKVVKTVYTDVAGAFSATNIKPGNYTLLVTKSGWSFPNPAVSVGPSNITLDIDALADGKIVKGGSKTNSSKSISGSN